MASLIEAFSVTDVYVQIKFGVTVKVASIANSNFLLNKTDATPSTVANPFKTIDIVRDYNSVSKILKLYFTDEILEDNSPYTLTVTNLTNVLDAVFANDSISFETGILNVDLATTIDAVYPDPVIIDYAISDHVFSVPVNNSTSTTILSLVSADPSDGSYYLYENENNGRISLTFNLHPDEDNLIAPYIKVQKREIKKAPTRWIDVDANFSLDNTDPIVYVDLPSVDHYPPAATPSTSSVYNVSGYTYFEKNYKYRILLSKNLSSLSDDATPVSYKMLADREVLFCGVLDPMYIDIDDLNQIYPDATNVEIAEQIHYYSLEVKNLLKLEDDVTEIPFVAMEYIKAAVACTLDKVYSLSSGFSTSFTLGDLTINKPKATGTLNRGTVNSWCELASVLRSELLSSSSRGGFRSVVKGSKYTNPIPVRKIRDFDALDTVTYSSSSLQGGLDILL